MFTGIIETTGIVEGIENHGSNTRFTISSPISHELKIDQSLAHDGACLTVESVPGNTHVVTAVPETLSKTILSTWQKGTVVNLERSMLINTRLDGHLVAGHVDCTATCIVPGSLENDYTFTFRFPSSFSSSVIEKGSICVNGISLTIFRVGLDEFSVAIIPYTYQHTNIRNLTAGSTVNIEFDMIGKYIQRQLAVRNL
jgi:riboflavin synthase